jgi:hypothetical protein
MTNARDRSLDVKMGQQNNLPPYGFKGNMIPPVIKKKDVSPSLSNFERDRAMLF